MAEMSNVMSEFLHQSLAEIRKFTPDLNKVTDEAAQVVALIEKTLADTGVGISAEVEAGSIGETDLKLAYQWSGGRFKIVVSAWHEYFSDVGQQIPNYDKIWDKPWTDCPRAEKLCSFKALPALLQKIAEEEKRAVQEMAGTAETIKAVMAAIKG